MSENNKIAQENVQQNSPNGQKPANAKGLIIIIVIIAVAIIGYFIMESINKNGGGSKVDLSVISEDDKIPLGFLNLQGKWERYDGDVKYIINFKSNNVLEFTQYDSAGNVTAESDTGTYEVEKDVLYLTMTSGGQSFADTCNAAVSVEKLVIKAVKGSSIFEGVYVVEEETRKELEFLEGLLNGTQQTEPVSSDNDENNNGGNGSENNNETQPAVSEITTSSEAIQTDPPKTEPPVSSQGVRISDELAKYLYGTREDIWGEDYPIYDILMAHPTADVECGGEVITLTLDYENLEDGTFAPTEVIAIYDCPVKILFEPKMQGNTFYDLKTLLGDELICEEDEYGSSHLQLSAEFDGFKINFQYEGGLTDDTLIRRCTIIRKRY